MNLKNKLEYYCKAYDENLVHCMNDKIKIVNIFLTSELPFEDFENKEI